MLARVQEEDCLGIAQARDDARERIGPASVDGIGDDPFDAPRATRARELDQPRAVTQVALERPPHLQREPALADAGWTRQRHEPVLAQ